MLSRTVLAALLVSCTARAVIIDRVAVRVGISIIKDSDISRNIRVTDFLNNEPLRLDNQARRAAAKRLIDQVFIRREIQLGDYPRATWEEADQQLDQLKKERFKSQAALQQAYARYGIVEPDLRFEFQWQLTVLRFVDQRFKPGVLVSDAEIEKYYEDHLSALRRAYPGKTLDDLRDQIRDILTGEKVNEQFFAWLDDQRKSTKVEFHEESLR
jgi:peptidyl-prolyl cis-trans isomerase SurA